MSVSKSLHGVKDAVAADVAKRIGAGEPLGGEVLSPRYDRIQVVGKSVARLQVRVIYAGTAPYYFNVTSA